MSDFTMLSDNENAVLAEMYSDSEYCIGYKFLEGTNGMTINDLKPIIKHLKELEYIVYYRGLMTEDGEVAGSGWCRSDLGNDYVEWAQL